MSKVDRINMIVEVIEKRYKDAHDNRKTWNKVYGQWLVYGLEKYIGFSNGVELCGLVEYAHKVKKPIKETLIPFFDTIVGE